LRSNDNLSPPSKAEVQARFPLRSGIVGHACDGR
jgi:hypothetical protein